MSLFDLSATYHLDADVAMPYEMGDDLAEVLSRPLDLEGRRSLRSGQSPVLWIGR